MDGAALSAVEASPSPQDGLLMIRHGAAVSAGFTLLAALCVAQPEKFKDCGSASGKILIVDITPCPLLPCVLCRGESYAVKVTFTSKTSSQKTVTVSGTPIPFNIPNADGCQSGIRCPIRNNQNYHYLNYLPIKKEYPLIKLWLNGS